MGQSASGRLKHYTHVSDLCHRKARESPSFSSMGKEGMKNPRPFRV